MFSSEYNIMIFAAVKNRSILHRHVIIEMKLHRVNGRISSAEPDKGPNRPFTFTANLEIG